MSKVAWLFPGQGSQAVGMGIALASKEIAAKSVIEEADSVLGFEISKLMAEGPEETLKLTEHTQPAILTHSIMVVRAYKEKLPKADFMAGHSLGEYSALVAAGALSFADAVKTVRERGRSMQVAVPFGVGAMTAIIGMTAGEIEDACLGASEKTGKVVVPANYNGAGQIVIAGHLEAVDAAMEILKGKGGRKMIKLPVSAPFHSPLMKPSQVHMRPVIQNLDFKFPSCPIVNNVDAAPVTDPEMLKDGFIRQIPGAVRWEATILFLLKEGVTQFFELGPGKVLAGIATRMAKDASIEIKATSIGAPED